MRTSQKGLGLKQQCSAMNIRRRRGEKNAKLVEVVGWNVRSRTTNTFERISNSCQVKLKTMQSYCIFVVAYERIAAI
jgi:hypothetical protein